MIEEDDMTTIQPNPADLTSINTAYLDRPPGVSPFLSVMTKHGPARINPDDERRSQPASDNITGECEIDPNFIEKSLRGRLHTQMARRRADSLRYGRTEEELVKETRPPLESAEGTNPPSESISIVAESLRLSHSSTIFADSLKLSEITTANLHSSRSVVLPAWPTDLVKRVQAAAHSSCNQPAKPEFRFELSHDAAIHNAEILSKYNFSLGAAIDANHLSPLGYGSEFRPVTVLSNIFRHHPNWSRLKAIMTRGSDWQLDELTEDARINDLADALTFGNHKGATAHPETLRRLIEKDVTSGFCLVIPPQIVSRIPGALMAPMNIMEQNTIDESGNIIPKQRLTHDQSFEWSSGTSVNSRVHFDTLLPCRYGGCLRRLINFVVAARRKYPNQRILATKVDYKSAYRRCHLNEKIAVQSITQLPDENLALISLRLTFGGAPGPYEWGVISESVCDLANALLHDDEWDPRHLSAPKTPPPMEALDDNIPFGIGKPLIVDIPVDPRGTVDCYIDDTVGLTVDLEDTDNTDRMRNVIPLAIHATARPVHKNEPIPRDEMAAEQKFKAEGALEERKTILGWLFDFRKLTVALPENKFVAWSDSINSMLATEKSTPRELEQLIGRLGHLASIIPMIHHFLSRLREAHFRHKNRRTIQLPLNVKEDLKLMLRLLEIGRKGIDLNTIAYLAPTHVYHSDSCPAGLGGYSNNGHAWRFPIPANLRFRASNNFLEFIAAIISPWIDIIEGRIGQGDCALSMTDSTTAEGWLHKTNFRDCNEDQEQVDAKIKAARKFALDFTTKGIKSYSQWFPGKENIVADALSRDDDRTDEELTSILSRFAPHQTPPNFRIAPLPSEIASWLTSLLLTLPVKEQYREEHTRTKLGRGDDGMIIANQLDSETLTLTHSTSTTESSSLEPLPWLCVREDFPATMANWLKAQSAVPSHLWFRPSGRMDGLTPRKTKIWSLDGFYTDYTEPSRTTTQK
jgi:hypothetical protein